MKYIFLHIVQFYIRIGLLFTLKKIRVTYQSPIPKDVPVLFLANHQNALLDPLLVTIKSNRFNYFLSRASVFKNPFIGKLLKSLQMLPVYRKRDGMHQISKNKGIFKYCARLLKKNQSIVIFPEGNHSLNRNVRNLSKGFTRIIEAVLKDDSRLDIYIIPVGLNYQNPTQWGDSVSVCFGSPIRVANYINSQKEVNVAKLKKDVATTLKQLTTHIEPGENYTTVLEKLNKAQVDYTKPRIVNEFINNNKKYTGKLIKKSSQFIIWLQLIIKIIFWGPYLVWKICLPKIKEAEFISTYRFAIILTLAPLFLAIQASVLSYFFSFTVGIFFFVSVLVLVRLTLILK